MHNGDTMTGVKGRPTAVSCNHPLRALFPEITLTVSVSTRFWVFKVDRHHSVSGGELVRQASKMMEPNQSRANK